MLAGGGKEVREGEDNDIMSRVEPLGGAAGSLAT